MSGWPDLPQAWLRAIGHRACRPPSRERHSLWAGPWRIGSVEPAVANEIGLQPLSVSDRSLQNPEWTGGAGWAVPGFADATTGTEVEALAMALNELALRLRGRGRAGAWRDEQLAVVPEGGADPVASIERAAVRPLGIATRAVHLVGWTADGGMWVQRRAATKANDPGLLDTLMGGMVAATDTPEQALERETWEEAGLRLTTLQALTGGGEVGIRQPSPDGGCGYMVERIRWWQAVLPPELRPENRDGEVDEFLLLTPQELVARLIAGQFTLEASLVLARALTARDGMAAPPAGRGLSAAVRG